MKPPFLKLVVAGLAGVLVALVAPVVWAAAPTIQCSGDQTLECSSPQGSVGVVEATVQDTDGDHLLVIFTLNGNPAVTNVVDSLSASNGVTLSFTNQYDFGTNIVAIGVTDDGTNVVTCLSTVVVQDTTPPVIDKIVATPTVLWPPNHRL